MNEKKEKKTNKISKLFGNEFWLSKAIEMMIFLHIQADVQITMPPLIQSNRAEY